MFLQLWLQTGSTVEELLSDWALSATFPLATRLSPIYHPDQDWLSSKQMKTWMLSTQMAIIYKGDRGAEGEVDCRWGVITEDFSPLSHFSFNQIFFLTTLSFVFSSRIWYFSWVRSCISFFWSKIYFQTQIYYLCTRYHIYPTYK